MATMTSGGAVALDDPVGESLRGHHAVLARLLGRGAFADLFSGPAAPPRDWEPVLVLEGRQMIWTGGGRPGQGTAAIDADVVELGADDLPEVLDLVARPRPGPFRPRSRELGTYRGVRGGGRLVAMAGERSEMGYPRPKAGGGSGRPDGPRSAPSARLPRRAAGATAPAWWARSPHAYRPGTNVPSCTWPRRAPVPSRSTNGSASRAGSR